MNRSQIEQSAALEQHLERLGQSTADIKRKMVPSGSGAYWLIDLADKTGAVEGVLHRVLERLVGQPAEVAQALMADGRRGWRCVTCSDSRNGWLPRTTRLDAIVAAIMEHNR